MLSRGKVVPLALAVETRSEKLINKPISRRSISRLNENRLSSNTL